MNSRCITLGVDASLSTTTLFLTADKISAFLGRGILCAWGLRLAGECAQESLGSLELSLPFGIPPALLITHQLHYLCLEKLCYVY